MPESQIHILIVGVPECDVQMHLVGITSALATDHETKVMFIIDASYEDAASRISSLPELDIVSLSNKVDLPRLKLSEGCEGLSAELAMHCANPWVHLPDPSVYFAGTRFRNLGIRATEKGILELIKERVAHKMTRTLSIGAPS